MKNIIKEAVNNRMPDKESIRINAMQEPKAVMPKKAYAVLAVAVMIAICTCIAVPMMINEPDDPTPIQILPTDTTQNTGDTVQGDDTTLPDDYNPNAIGGGEGADVFGIGGSGPFCYIHDDSYHFFDSRFISYIGEDRFFEWGKSTEQPEGIDPNDHSVCPFPNSNIFDCIEYLGLTDDEIIDIYKNELFYDVHWDMEALLARDREAFEAHMLSIRNNEELQVNLYRKLKEEAYIKLNIIKKIGEKEDEKSKEYYEKIKDTSVCNITMLEMVENSSLTRKDLEDIIPRKPYIAGDYKVFYYVYNLDLLFEDRDIYKAEIEKLDIPYYESEVKAIDALLHIETRLSVTEEGKAVNTENGIYIPEGKLPLSVKENEELEKKFIVYNGNTYWLTEHIYTNDDEKTAMVDKHIGEVRRDYLRQRYSWEVFTYNDLSSNIRGDVYSLKNFDDSLRIALVPYDGCPYILIFESNKGITLKTGSDVLDLEGYKNVYIPYGKPLSKKTEKYLPKFTNSLYDAEFVIADVDTDTAIPLKFEFTDGRTTILYLYEGGYVAYEHHLGYNVYLKISERMYKYLSE